MSWPADREQRRAVLALLDPGNIGAEAEADHQLHPHPDPAANAAHQPHHVGGVAARRHEIDQVDRAVSGLEPRLQDQRIVPIAARGARDLPRRRDQPAAVLLGAEQRGKAGIGIEGRPAQPVDRSVAADQRRGLAIADQPIIFDPARQGCSPPDQIAARDRSCVAAFSAATSIVDAISSSGTGSRRRQFGCSLTVPGILGWSTTPEQILQRDREQPRFGPRQEIRHRIEIVAVDGVMAQHVVQHRQRMPARIVALAGIDAERALQLEIAERAPAGIGREIVGVEGDERIGQVMIDAAERAVRRRARTSSPDTTRCPNRRSARETLPARCRGLRRSRRSGCATLSCAVAASSASNGICT